MGAANGGAASDAPLATQGDKQRSPEKKTRLLSARREFLEILVDKSTSWRSKMLGDLGESIKTYLLDDADMWPGFRKKCKVILDNLWEDIEHEVTRAITSSVAPEDDHDNIPGPEGCCLFALWFRIRAFVLHHYLPHNKSIFGKLNDPFYLVLYVLSFLPVHGVRVIMFGIILFMLLFPGKPDEFQLINFILLFKGFQFFTSGILVMAYGVFCYFSCYTFHKDNLLECMDTNGPAPTSATATAGLLVDYGGSIVLVWIAFACLSCSVSSVQELQRKRLKEGGTETDEERYRRERVARAVNQETARGGRIRGLLTWDMKCFFFSLFLLFLSAVFTCNEHFENGGSWYRLFDSAQFRTNVYWCCDVYAVLSLPFAFYLIPGLMEILTHSDATGFNKNGACVYWIIPSSQVSEPDVEEALVEPTFTDKIAHLGVKIVRTVERGQESRGADASSEYKFGDWTRGAIASYFPKTTDQDAAGAASSSSSSTANNTSAWFANLMPSKPVPKIDEEPFHVSAVRITHVEEGHPTYYFMEVTPFCNLGEAATPWIVKRRYNDFKELARALGQQCHYKETPFPERSRFVKLTGEALDARRHALELWLGSVILDSAVQDRWAAALRAFLSSTETGTEHDAEADPEKSPSAGPASIPPSFTPSDLRQVSNNSACSETPDFPQAGNRTDNETCDLLFGTPPPNQATPEEFHRGTTEEIFV